MSYYYFTLVFTVWCVEKINASEVVYGLNGA